MDVVRCILMKPEMKKQGMKTKIEIRRLHKLDGSGATKAFADISLNDEFVVKGVRVVHGAKGLFVAMPQEIGKDGKSYNTVIPLTREVKDQIEKLILNAYGDGGEMILKTVQSSKNPGKTYDIVQGNDGVIYCTCPRWKFKKTCKHLEAYHAAFTQSVAAEPNINDTIADAVRMLKGE